MDRVVLGVGSWSPSAVLEERVAVKEVLRDVEVWSGWRATRRAISGVRSRLFLSSDMPRPEPGSGRCGAAYAPHTSGEEDKAAERRRSADKEGRKKRRDDDGPSGGTASASTAPLRHG